MTYKSLMVHLQLGQDNANVLKAAAELSQRFKAHVVGITACQPIQMIYGEGYAYGDLIEQSREELTKETGTAEAQFRSALEKHASSLEWRSTMMTASIADFLSAESRSADLIITGIAGGNLFDAERRADMGDLVMQAGRPVLLVPAAAGQLNLKLEQVIVAWKDTRETRRAVVDAMPLLKLASRVLLVEIAAQEDIDEARMQLGDVAAWLKRHGIETESLTAPSKGDDAAGLNAIALEKGADLVVAGAYGHSRLREWALGGVTRDLLLRSDRCAFVSH